MSFSRQDTSTIRAARPIDRRVPSGQQMRFSSVEEVGARNTRRVMGTLHATHAHTVPLMHAALGDDDLMSEQQQ
ncbi:MAG: hypothetical protein JWQ90_929 [Hydrocarboniphaga sp.]|uniref:hypothetical protein n=1 Tax=Hydrocarboniphaga sp. TaxID=2033016 RepID=UPI002617A89E|nr:hypothetical protein [Hydrocarboniphaga sp.]MDB5968479.1 hypothetical protein [Hydrocarboniphaga sp.]